MKRSSESITQLSKAEHKAEEEINKLQAQLCLRRLEHWLGRMHWQFESAHTGHRDGSSFEVRLNVQTSLLTNFLSVAELSVDWSNLTKGIQIWRDSFSTSLPLSTPSKPSSSLLRTSSIRTNELVHQRNQSPHPHR